MELASAPSGSAVDGGGTVARAYLLVWCVSYTLPAWNSLLLGPGVGGLDERPLIAADYVLLLPLAVLLLLGVVLALFNDDSKSRGTTSSGNHFVLPLALLVHVVDLAIRWHRLPDVWDHEQWACQVELAFVAIFGLQQFWRIQQQFAVTTSTIAETTFLRVFRLQFALFYFAATFWKLNTSFLEFDTSCGSVLILELAGTYLPELSSKAAVELLARLSPHITLVTEAALGGVMLLSVVSTSDPYRNQWYRYASVLMGSAFHLSIFLLPVNGAGGFSMDCVRHFVLFFEPSELQKLSQHWKPSSSIGYALVAAGLIRLRHDRVGLGFDFGFFGVCILLCLYMHVIVAACSTQQGVKKGDYKIEGAAIKPGESFVNFTLRHVSALVLFVSFCYAYIGPILGLQHMGAPTMYSNLRYYHGGNHLLVPTSILPEDIIYGGGLVQVLQSTCTQLNYRLAHIQSKDVFPPTAMKYYETALSARTTYQLFPLCISNPHSFDVLREDYEKTNYVGSESFASFTLPISEVRKALKEAALFSQPYRVTLKEDSTDIHVILDSNGGCQLTTAGGEPVDGETCAENRLARALLRASDEPPAALLGSLWLAKIAKALTTKLLTPYPQLVGWKEEMCMS